MKKYKKGDVVTVEIDGVYGRSMFINGVVVDEGGELQVKVKGFESGEEAENEYDYETQYVSINEIID